MAEQAVRAVLEQLLVALGTPKNGEPRRGALLVALTAGGALGGALCTLTGGPRGVQELPGAPPNPPPCCGRILARAQVQRSFQICHPPPLSPTRGSLWRLLHRTSLVHPEVEFHFCVSIDGNVTSRSMSPEPPWAQAGARLRVQSQHFTGAGAPRCHIWVRWDPPEGTGTPKLPLRGTPKLSWFSSSCGTGTRLGGTMQGCAGCSWPSWSPRCASAAPRWPRGLRALLHPLLGGLRRQHQAQQRMAQAQALAVAAVMAVVAASSSGRFRSACLGALQVQDTPALAAAARRRWAEVSRRPGLPRGGTPQKQRRGWREEQHEEEEEEGPGATMASNSSNPRDPPSNPRDPPSNPR
ncbi:uncharacterized protein [Anomalospiza imberbis]|uniref:uncharacterized protein n=1 Tax=Anomalospiza imberbis TaxID=187417 RepID=UPI00358EA100